MSTLLAVVARRKMSNPWTRVPSLSGSVVVSEWNPNEDCDRKRCRVEAILRPWLPHRDCRNLLVLEQVRTSIKFTSRGVFCRVVLSGSQLRIRIGKLNESCNICEYRHNLCNVFKSPDLLIQIQ
jgi:hypothetical protein